MIQVEIFGQTYNVRGDEDRGYIEELAHFVDTKMKTIAEGTGTIDSLKVSILAALNIADEYFKLEHKIQANQERMTDKTDELSEILDDVL